MANLTRDNRIAFDTTDLHAPLGYELLVYKKQKSGAVSKFLKHLQPGERFRTGLFGRDEDFIAYQVSQDAHLRYSFDRECKTRDDVNDFIVHITLDYAVNDAERIVEYLESDPLGRLVERAGSTICDRLGRLPWAIIYDGGAAFEDELLQRWQDNKNVTGSCMERLQEFARQMGFALETINISRTLSEDDVDLPKAAKNAKKQLTKNQINRSLAEQSRTFTQQDRAIEQQFKQQLDFQGAAGKAVTGTIDYLGSNLKSMRDLSKFAEDLTGLPSTTAVPHHPGHAAGAYNLNTPPGVATAPRQLPPVIANHGEFSRILEFLTTQLHDISDLKASDERLACTSTILHLVAEAILDDRSDSELLDRYSKQLKSQLDAAAGAGELDRQQRRRLLEQLDAKNLSSQLKGS
ncbi:MAG: hypothetical protein MJE77_08885 [Proteobacteria bacterium]|nr:hypothetical protein [Pseudomonadota bacterium]